MRLNVADLSTVETLVQELSHPDPARVRLRHRRAGIARQAKPGHAAAALSRVAGGACRALGALGAARPDIAERWAPHIRRMLGDPSAGVRAAAIRALTRHQPRGCGYTRAPDGFRSRPAYRVTAAVALADSSKPDDDDVAEATFVGVIADTPAKRADARSDVAVAVRQTRRSRFKRLLIPLFYDPVPEVADEAMMSVRASGSGDFVFVPTLIALLRQPPVQGRRHARCSSATASRSIDVLAHFMRDPEEDIWVRRHIPARWR